MNPELQYHPPEESTALEDWEKELLYGAETAEHQFNNDLITGHDAYVVAKTLSKASGIVPDLVKHHGNPPSLPTVPFEDHCEEIATAIESVPIEMTGAVDFAPRKKRRRRSSTLRHSSESEQATPKLTASEYIETKRYKFDSFEFFENGQVNRDELLCEAIARIDRGSWFDEGQDDYGNEIDIGRARAAINSTRFLNTWGPDEHGFMRPIPYKFDKETVNRLSVQGGVEALLFLIKYPDNFPDFVLTQQLVETCLDHDDGEINSLLLRMLSNFGPDIDTQRVVNRICENQHISEYTLCDTIDVLPDIIIPAKAVRLASRTGALKIREWLAYGRLDHIKDDPEAVKDIGIEAALMCGMANMLDIESIRQEVGQDVDVRVLYVLLASIEDISDLAANPEFVTSLVKDNVDRLIHYHGSFRSLSPELQRMIFHEHLARGFTLSQLWRYPDGLGEDEQQAFLEQCEDEIAVSCADLDSDWHNVKAFFEVSASAHVQERFAELVERANPTIAKVERANISRKARVEVERAYFQAGDFAPQVSGPYEQLTPEESARRFELDHCVKSLPTLDEQAEDASRTNTIEFARRFDRVTITEHAAINGYIESIDTAIAESHDEQMKALKSLRHNLSFIGKKEYEEAAQGVLSYWKHLLDGNPKQQIYVVRDHLAEPGSEMSSAEYLLDSIIGFMSDEEIKAYKGRLVMRLEDVTADDPKNVRAVLLDDWTISGSQMRAAAIELWRQRPDLMGQTELQLLVASKARLAMGIENTAIDRNEGVTEYDLSLPVRAYYMAHHAESMVDDPQSPGTHITGHHSSVDFGFDNLLSEIKNDSRGVLGNLPLPLKSVKRPYKARDWKRHNILRFAVLTGASHRDLSEFEFVPVMNPRPGGLTDWEKEVLYGTETTKPKNLAGGNVWSEI